MVFMPRKSNLKELLPHKIYITRQEFLVALKHYKQNFIQKADSIYTDDE